MNSVTHITGCELNICGRVIQRCSLCGEKLIDSLNESRPLKPDGTDPGVLVWPVGRLVQVSSGNPKRSVLLDETDKLSEDSCIVLVE
jgi:hypothetical protein